MIFLQPSFTLKQTNNASLGYIVDFYCSAAKLVIELDGNQHNTNERVVDSDRVRDEYMESLGIKVVRFSNLDIEKNFFYICEWIDHTIQDRIRED